VTIVIMLGGARRILFKLLIAGAMLVLLAVAGFAVWLFSYAADLPDVRGMTTFSPSIPTPVSAMICGESKQVIAVPVPQNVRWAILASEGDFDPRGVPRRIYDGLVGEPSGHKYGTYSSQISRYMCCNDHGSVLMRSFREVRTQIQLERYFTSDEILGIYLNRVYFGAGIYGAENAAEYYFGKHSSQLSTAEAALLAAIIRSPNHFSPRNHPERAITERNEIIDAMAQRGSISVDDAEAAKQAPLRLGRS
jgi:penicillin-binding protein 2A